MSKLSRQSVEKNSSAQIRQREVYSKDLEEGSDREEHTKEDGYSKNSEENSDKKKHSKEDSSHEHAQKFKASKLRRTKPTVPMKTKATPSETRWLGRLGALMLDVILKALSLLTWPLAILVVGVIAWLVFLVLRSIVLQKVCSLRLLSSTRLCTYEPVEVPNFTNMYQMQSKLADIHFMNAQSAGLSAAIQHGQLAMEDIEIAISVSNIPGKEEMSRHLNEFMSLARPTIPKLMRYQADSSQSVEFALGLNRWAKGSLEAIDARPQLTISRPVEFLDSWISGRTAIGSVQKIYVYYTKELYNEMTSLIENGESLYSDLYTLQKNFQTVVRSMSHEQRNASERKGEIDTYQAIIFRLHREELKAVKQQLDHMAILMRDIGLARNITQDTINKLQPIHIEIQSLLNALGRPGAQLALSDSDIGYCISQIGTVIESLEKGKKQVLKEKHRHIG